MPGPFTMLLGTAQDAGIPQAGCSRSCCDAAWTQPHLRRLPACLGLIDPTASKRFMIDCTPAFPEQLHLMGQTSSTPLDGILLTHAHIGHYAGLVHLGREAMATDHLPLFTMPRMGAFLKRHQPWRHLLDRGNISLEALSAGQAHQLTDTLSIVPLPVPHRDEDSETVCFVIKGPNRSLLYIPDIDAWEAWDTPIEDMLASVDRAYLDGTFFSWDEIPGRDPARIPHPCIFETLTRFEALSPELRDRVHFIHLNHTNPAADPTSAEAARIRDFGAHVATEGQRFDL